MIAHDGIIASHVMQMHHMSHQWQAGNIYSPGDRVYLLIKNLALPLGRAKKLLPKFIGPYKVLEVHTATSMVTLELSLELTAQQVHPTFHVNLLRAHVPNNDTKFLHRYMKSFYASEQPTSPNGS